MKVIITKKLNNAYMTKFMDVNKDDIINLICNIECGMIIGRTLDLPDEYKVVFNNAALKCAKQIQKEYLMETIVIKKAIGYGEGYELIVQSYPEEVILGGTSFGHQMRTEVVNVPYTKIFWKDETVTRKQYKKIQEYAAYMAVKRNIGKVDNSFIADDEFLDILFF